MKLCCQIVYLCWAYLWLGTSLVAVQSIRIATYNLENYLVMDRYVGAKWRPAYPKPEAEKAAVRNAILSVSPDILALQEIGGLPFLEELRADLAQEGLHYEYAIHMRADDSVRHIAVLSRIAPEVVVKHDDLDFNYIDGREKVRRGLLEVVFPFGDGGAFQLFVVHLKSHWSDVEEDPNSTLRRTREAEACRNRIVERSYDLSQDRFLIAGDFNDHPGSATLRRFYKRGELSIGARVPAADSRGEVWTLFYEKQSQYLTFDGFVASPELGPQIEAGRALIVDEPGMLRGSDHRLLYLDLIVSETDSVPAK